MLGYWIGYVAEGYSPCNVFLDITSDKHSAYGGATGDKGCDLKVSGKVRYNKTHIYVGTTEFKFIEKPFKIENGDSIIFASVGKGLVHSKIYGEMILMNSIFNRHVKYKFTKVLEY